MPTGALQRTLPALEPLAAPTIHAPTRAPRHLKVFRRADGGVALEFCEDPGCAVESGGRADCGRLACPHCGRGGHALSALQLTDLLPGEAVACTCGHAWVPAA